MKNPIKTNHKYASRFVCDRINVLIENKLKSVKKNPKTTRKWLHKMKLSILKKVSIASQTLFNPTKEVEMDKLKNEVEEVEKRIKLKQENIQKLITQSIDSSPSFLNHIMTATLKSMEEFGPSVDNICQNLRDSKEKMDNLIKIIPDQIESFQATLKSIEDHLDKHQSQKDIHMKHYSMSTDQTSHSSSVSSRVSLRSKDSSHSSPLKSLENHLQRE